MTDIINKPIKKPWAFTIIVKCKVVFYDDLLTYTVSKNQTKIV